MSGSGFDRYKRLVQGFFDAEPKNDDVSGSSIWCLGREYSSGPVLHGSETSEPDLESYGESARPEKGKSLTTLTNGVHENQGGNQVGTTEAEKAWPVDFVIDCESRAWFTYRSGFAPIPKSTDASMTLSVRLRSLVDHQGFTSDTGWGCMIRSGQSLLANALTILRLGRGIKTGKQFAIADSS